MFLDLEQGNHSVFDYTRPFNNLAQYGSSHVDTDEKKANLYHEGLPSVIPCSEIEGTKPPYVCPGCFIHTYSNNMINRFHVQ
jgi:hypothetical protein